MRTKIKYIAIMLILYIILLPIYGYASSWGELGGLFKNHTCNSSTLYTQDQTINIGAKVGTSVDLQSIASQFKVDKCEKTESDGVKLVSSRLSSDTIETTNCSASLVGTQLIISDVVGLSADIKITIPLELSDNQCNTYTGGRELDTSITIHIVREVTDPKIEAEYDFKNQLIHVTVKSNGNPSTILKASTNAQLTDVYSIGEIIDDTRTEDGELISKDRVSDDIEINFPLASNEYKDVTFDILHIEDLVRPNRVKENSIKLVRDTSTPLKLKLSWESGQDNDNYIYLYTTASNKQAVNIKSDYTREEVSLMQTDGSGNKTTTVILEKTNNQNQNNITFTVDGPSVYTLLNANAKLVITSYDFNDCVRIKDSINEGNKSLTYDIAIQDDLIYSTQKNLNEKKNSGNHILAESVNEGSALIIDIAGNDKKLGMHDTFWTIPELHSVELIEGKGTVSIKKGSELGADGADIGDDELVIYYQSVDDDSPQITLKYYYSKLREDLYADTNNTDKGAYGYIVFSVNNRNQEPKTEDITATEIESVVGKDLLISGQDHIDIPMSLIYKHATDREMPEGADKGSYFVKFTTKSNNLTPTGTTFDSDVYNSSGDRVLRISLPKHYYGMMEFEYSVTDPGLLESNYSTISINVILSPNPPRADPIDDTLDISETTKSIQLSIVNPNNLDYSLVDPKDTVVKLNGVPLDKTSDLKLTSSTFGGEGGKRIPFIRLMSPTTPVLNPGDVLEFEYTIKYILGASEQTSTALIKLTIIDGDDVSSREGTIYVHRRPIASFAPKILLNSQKTAVAGCEIKSDNELSYDLDHMTMHDSSVPMQSTNPDSKDTRPDYSYKGLRTWEWSVKLIKGNVDSGWLTKVFDAEGKGWKTKPEYNDKGEQTKAPTFLTGGDVNYGSADGARNAGLAWIQEEVSKRLAGTDTKTVMIALRVRDIDAKDTVGEWSSQYTVTLTATEMKPVALFTVDKSTIIVTKDDAFKINMVDSSYDPNGGDLTKWKWELLDANGSVLQTFTYNNPGKVDKTKNADAAASQFSKTIQNIVTNNWTPKDPRFKIKLTVEKQSNDANCKVSDPLTWTITVYLDNEAPVVDVKDTQEKASLVYEIDKGLDGTVGDTLGQTPATGMPDFTKWFSVTDDQGANTKDNLSLSWEFYGESVSKRSLWNELEYIVKQYAKTGLAYFESPLKEYNTVTDAGFVPGAYKVQLTIRDNPKGSQYAPGSSKTTYWSTYGDKVPYHLFVVPALTINANLEFNGWEIVLDENRSSGSKYAFKWVNIETGEEVLDTDYGVVENIAPTIGDTVTVKAVTNKYVDKLSYSESSQGSGWVEMRRLPGQGLNGEITWEGSYTIEDADDPTEENTKKNINLTEFKFSLKGETTWGSEEEKTTRTKIVPMTIWVLPIKIYDFRVTELTDPSLSDKFNRYVKEQLSGDKLDNGSVSNGALVRRLAVENKDISDNIETLNMKKGYAFYFELNSKGLKKGGDQIVIYPRFFGLRDDNTLVELDGYVPNKKGQYVPFTTADGVNDEYIKSTYSLYYQGSRVNGIGNHYEVKINTDLREELDGNTEQLWHGRYGIPGDTRFFKKNTSVSMDNEWRGKVLVAFNIAAYKDGKPRFNYVERGQWEKERVNGLKTEWKAIENQSIFKSGNLGAVIVYDAGYNIKDDYSSNPLWRE